MLQCNSFLQQGKLHTNDAKRFSRIKTGTLETIRIKTNKCMTVPIHKQVRDLSFQVAPKYCKTTAKEHLQVSLLVNIIT